MNKIKIKKNNIKYNYYISKSSSESDTKSQSDINSDLDFKFSMKNAKYKSKKRHRKVLYEDSAVIDRLFYEINELKKSLNDVILNSYNMETKILVDFKKEVLELDENKIKMSLNMASIFGDIILFKAYYLNNKMSPIKSLNNRHYEYWCDGRWNRDEFGKKIMDIITNNLKSTYTRVNTIGNYDLDKFLKNQQHIFRLSDIKYKRELLREIHNQINTSSN